MGALAELDNPFWLTAGLFGAFLTAYLRELQTETNHLDQIYQQKLTGLSRTQTISPSKSLLR